MTWGFALYTSCGLGAHLLNSVSTLQTRTRYPLQHEMRQGCGIAVAGDVRRRLGWQLCRTIFSCCQSTAVGQQRLLPVSQVYVWIRSGCLWWSNRHGIKVLLVVVLVLVLPLSLLCRMSMVRVDLIPAYETCASNRAPLQDVVF